MIYQETIFVVFCDHKGSSWENPDCQKAYEGEDTESVGTVIKDSEKEGWVVIGNMAFCSEHADSEQAKEIKEKLSGIVRASHG